MIAGSLFVTNIGGYFFAERDGQETRLSRVGTRDRLTDDVAEERATREAIAGSVRAPETEKGARTGGPGGGDARLPSSLGKGQSVDFGRSRER